MTDMVRYASQFVFLALVMAFIGYFSSRPVYQQVPDGMAQIKLSFAHGGALFG